MNLLIFCLYCFLLFVKLSECTLNNFNVKSDDSETSKISFFQPGDALFELMNKKKENANKIGPSLFSFIPLTVDKWTSLSDVRAENFDEGQNSFRVIKHETVSVDHGKIKERQQTLSWSSDVDVEDNDGVLTSTY